jgi:hypothetical protein
MRLGGPGRVRIAGNQQARGIRLNDRMTEGMLPKLSLIYLTALAFFTWGLATGRYEVFPFDVLEPIYSQAREYLLGDPSEKTTLVEKVQSDFLGVPKRFIHPSITTQYYSKYDTVRHPSKLFKESRASPLFFSNVAGGAYLVFGVFEFSDGRTGAILLNQRGEILRHWVFHPSPGNNELNPGKGGVVSNGIIVSNAFYELQAQNYCGVELWRDSVGEFHHSVESTSDDDIWVSNGFYLELRKSEIGEIKDRFSVFEIIEANPDIHIFEPRLNQLGWVVEDLADFEQAFPKHEISVDDPFHLNDISPLSQTLAHRYMSFERGDLLVSSRALNLVFIVRPRNREVVWHIYGITSRQHDPDFNEFGTITIFDNKTHALHSRIIEIHPETEASKVLLNGAKYGLKNERHGNHSYLPDRSIIFIDFKGRIVHVDRNGDVVFEYQNVYSLGHNLELRNVHYLTESDVERLERSCEDSG